MQNPLLNKVFWSKGLKELAVSIQELCKGFLELL